MARVHDRIEVNSKIMLGKPVIKGTRVPVELILRKLGEGATEADLLDAYPHLTAHDIRAAVAYAADVVAHEEADPWTGYDAERVRKALRASAGALHGVNRKELLADIRAQRGQDSRGRVSGDA